MDASVSIKSLRVDVSENIVRSLELSNGQKFQVWKPKYTIETVEDEDSGTISAKITSLEELFTVFAVSNDESVSVKEVTKDDPVEFEVADYEDLAFTFVNYDGLTAFKPSGLYPIEG